MALYAQTKNELKLHLFAAAETRRADYTERVLANFRVLASRTPGLPAGPALTRQNKTLTATPCFTPRTRSSRACTTNNGCTKRWTSTM